MESEDDEDEQEPKPLPEEEVVRLLVKAIRNGVVDWPGRAKEQRLKAKQQKKRRSYEASRSWAKQAPTAGVQQATSASAGKGEQPGSGADSEVAQRLLMLPAQAADTSAAGDGILSQTLAGEEGTGTGTSTLADSFLQYQQHQRHQKQ